MTAAVPPLPLQAFMVWTGTTLTFSSTCLRKYKFDYNRYLLEFCNFLVRAVNTGELVPTSTLLTTLFSRG